MDMQSLEERAHSVLQCLIGTLNAGHDIRESAEKQLTEQSRAEGFGLVLCKIIAAGPQQVEDGVRQLAAVVLKKYIKERWDKDAKHYQPPTVRDEEKALVRQALLQGGCLADASSKVRTAVGMAIAAIANFDWSQAWPELLECLIKGIQHGSSQEQGEEQDEDPPCAMQAGAHACAYQCDARRRHCCVCHACECL